MPLSEVTLSAKLFSTSSYTFVKFLILALRSSSGPLEAAETRPGPNTPPTTEPRAITNATNRTDRTQRGIDTSLLQYIGFSATRLRYSSAGPPETSAAPDPLRCMQWSNIIGQ